jgi:hypothetical protein
MILSNPCLLSWHYYHFKYNLKLQTNKLLEYVIPKNEKNISFPKVNKLKRIKHDYPVSHTNQMDNVYYMNVLNKDTDDFIIGKFLMHFLLYVILSFI